MSFGESHGSAVGGVIDGCPAGIALSADFIQGELNRRRPGQSEVSTPRKEEDTVEILSGIFEGKSTGMPIGFLVRNQNQNSKDYNHLKDLYRPSHADYTWEKKYGIRDYRGGGRLSAREHIARVVAGAVAGDQIEAQGVGAVLLRHLQRVDAVAQRLGHLAALVVAHQTVDQHGLEGLLLHLLHAGEDHAGHPEEDDIVAGDQHGGGIPVVQVGSVQIGPAQRGEGPQGGAEPGVQHVLLAGQVGAAALLALGGILTADVDMAALIAVPRGDLMAPP